MKNLLANWFRSLTAFENTPVKQEFSIADPTSADPKGLNTVTLSVSPSDGQSPTMVSLYFEASGVKLFEKQYQDDQDAQTELSAMAQDLNEAASLSKEGKIDEAKNLVSSLIEKYKRSSDTLVQPSPVTTNTQASQNNLEYKGFQLTQEGSGHWNAILTDRIALRAESVSYVKAKIDKMFHKAAGKTLKKEAGITQSNWFFDTVDEAMEFQEKMKALQGPEGGEGNKPLWEQMGGEEHVAPSNETAPEEDNELAPPSLSFDRIEKDKAKTDKDIGKRIKEQVKTEVESALEQKSASVFGPDQEELVEALRKNGRNWDEIKKIFVKELSYNEDDTTVFLDSIRQKEEGGPVEGLPLPPKPPEDLVSPETHDKLVKEIEDKSEPKPEPLPLADEIARADNTEIRKVATNKVALNPLQEPPAVGQTPGQPLAAPVEENPTFDAPVPAAPEATPEPEFLEAPQEGDRVYVMGDYETGEDGYEGTMVSDYTSKGDEYAVISKDDGDNAEVALHRVVKASQKKVAQIYYEKKADYQGYSNFSTWGLSLWLDNERGLYDLSRNLAQEIKDPEVLAKNLKSNFNGLLEEKQEEGKSSNEVNWNEIAQDLLNEAKENAEYEKSQSAPTQIEKLPTLNVEEEKDKIINQLQTETDPAKKQELERKYKHLTMSSIDPELQSLHESALKLQAELEYEGETAFYFTKEGIEKKAAGDSAFEANGWCRVWIQDDEIDSDRRYQEILKLADENARIKALKELARELAHEALRDADEAAGKFGVQQWFEGLTPSHHDRIDWVKLANPISEEEEDRRFEEEMARKYGPESAQNPKIEKKAEDEISLIMAYEDGQLDDSGILKLFSLLIKNGHAWSLQGHYGRTAKALIDAGYIDKQGNILKDIGVESSKKYAFVKQAADPVPPAEGPKEVPTTFKKHLKAPPATERELAQPASTEQAQLVKEVESSLSSLEAIKSLVDQAKAKLNAEIKAIEQAGGRVQIEGELKQKIDQLSKLVEATQNKMIYAGDTMVRLIQETKEHPFKPSDKWVIEKLTERLSKYEDAAKYLKQAEDGAQHLATSEDIRELYFFPRGKTSKLSKKANFLDTLDEVYNSVLEALKLIVGSEQEQPTAV